MLSKSEILRLLANLKTTSDKELDEVARVLKWEPDIYRRSHMEKPVKPEPEVLQGLVTVWTTSRFDQKDMDRLNTEYPGRAWKVVIEDVNYEWESPDLEVCVDRTGEVVDVNPVQLKRYEQELKEYNYMLMEHRGWARWSTRKNGM